MLESTQCALLPRCPRGVWTRGRLLLARRGCSCGLRTPLRPCSSAARALRTLASRRGKRSKLSSAAPRTLRGRPGTVTAPRRAEEGPRQRQASSLPRRCTGMRWRLRATCAACVVCVRRGVCVRVPSGRASLRAQMVCARKSVRGTSRPKKGATRAALPLRAQLWASPNTAEGINRQPRESGVKRPRNTLIRH